MKKKKSLGVGWSILLLSFTISLIAILIPNGYQGATLFFVVMAWNVWVVSTKLYPYLRRKACLRAERKAHKEEIQIQQNITQAKAMENALQLHVNHRITECLHKIYPNATWAWMEKDSMQLILQGGIGRIRVNGVEHYEHADVKIEPMGKITCSMVNQVPASKNPKTEQRSSPAPMPLNPQIWYEKQGRNVLLNVITDLHSRGHASLTVADDGSIIIQENEEAVKISRLIDFPTRSYWNQLVQVFQREGLAAKIEPKGLQLTW